MDASIYSCIARGKVILVNYSNSSIISQTILSNVDSILNHISISSNTKYEQTTDGLFYNVSVDKGLSFCMVSANLNRNTAILAEVQRDFFKYPEIVLKAQTCNTNELSAVYGESLKGIVNKFCDPSRIDQLRNQVNDVREIMTANVELVLARGERLEDLIDKSEDLESSSSQFRNHAKQVKRKMYCKNAKWTIIGISVVVIAIIIIIFVILYNTGVLSKSDHTTPKPP